MDQLAAELEALGYSIDLSHRQLGILVIPNYKVEIGRYAGTHVDLGIPAQDYPFTPPACVHVRPGLDYSGPNNIIASSLGSDWRYWSRRLDGWTQERSARRIIAYINRIFLDA